MDNIKIKEALINALALLNREVKTEILQEAKAEYRRVIIQLENAVKEFDQ
jgi:hypothetical protein